MENYSVLKQILKEFYNTSEAKENVHNEIKNLDGGVKIEPKLIYNRYTNNLKLEIKIGTKQFYKVKSLPEFYDKFISNERFKYGSKLEFVHTKEAFCKEDQKLLEFVLKYAEIIKYANEASTGYNYYTKRLGEDSIILSNSGLDELFEAMIGKSAYFEDMLDKKIIFFEDEDPKIEFELKKSTEKEYTIKPNIDIYSYKIYNGKNYVYFLLDNKLYRVNRKFENTVLKLLEILKLNFTTEIRIPQEKLTEFFSIVESNMKNKIKIDEKDYEKIKKFIPSELYAKLYLDYNSKNFIIAKIEFVYENEKINPLIEENKTVMRNLIKEEKLIDMLVKSGFMLDNKNHELVLADEDKIYKFLTDDIQSYMENFEILATDRFKEREIKPVNLTNIGIKIDNNLLNIDFSNLYFDVDELEEIMSKYKLKKKYHRLKNGSFINLENNETLDFINSITADIDIDYSNIKNGSISIPMYRSLYLEKILENSKNIKAEKSASYKNFVQDLNKSEITDFEKPKRLNASLRQYQKVGANWLKMLDTYGLGGILADDMGLGKTVQILSVITKYLEEGGNKPSIVVCPSSLSLNWQNEIEKFTQSVSSEVIHGSLEERKKQIQSINNYNIIITSYDLLKRDIEIYQEEKIQFKYIVADEAQYIKNNNTQNAKAIKKIKAETKFALTGTPIENSLAELWSIFDFIMPGYLFSYRKFKELYETPIVKENDEEAIKKLRKLIEPFVLRRIKKEVLTELPEKVITVLNSQMTEEQEDVYLAYLAKAKKTAINEIKENGIEKSGIKILALLTRLRQICCHPSLFLENYEGESGKMNQCIEIIKDAIASDHKILLFSGYTTMFNILEKALQNEKIEYMKLTGQTKVSERMDLVDEFNKNPDKKIFLISLKTGGTGLNLTGADVVIHYDPWWNISSENQATDRTYRIGQKKNVQVYKLITKNSIEEKIYDLQKRKEKLIDNVLSGNQTFISKLSKEEILSLFE